MMERTSKLRRKIIAWIDVQQKFFPALANIRACEDEVCARVAEGAPIPGVTVSSIKLWLPSHVASAPAADAAKVVLKTTVLLHEYRLRVGIAAEALHDIRRYLLVWMHLYKLKDAHSCGMRDNMRSSDKLAALNEQTKRAAAEYRVVRAALVVLGRRLNRKEWEWTLLPLLEDDVRGLPQSHFHDPKRKKKRKGKKRPKKAPPKLSWIWVNRGESWEPGDNAAMN
jgi:hypothetical protein